MLHVISATCNGSSPSLKVNSMMIKHSVYDGCKRHCMAPYCSDMTCQVPHATSRIPSATSWGTELLSCVSLESGCSGLTTRRAGHHSPSGHHHSRLARISPCPKQPCMAVSRRPFLGTNQPINNATMPPSVQSKVPTLDPVSGCGVAGARGGGLGGGFEGCAGRHDGRLPVPVGGSFPQAQHPVLLACGI